MIFINPFQAHFCFGRNPVKYAELHFHETLINPRRLFFRNLTVQVFNPSTIVPTYGAGVVPRSRQGFDAREPVAKYLQKLQQRSRRRHHAALPPDSDSTGPRDDHVAGGPMDGGRRNLHGNRRIVTAAE